MAHKHKSNDCVSLDLFVGDEDDDPNSTQSNVVETLCLRILSKSNVKYKFGGLQIHIRSPSFSVGKSFHVNLDENNRIDSIESYREPEESFQFCRRRVSLLNSNNIYNTQPARILITPKKQPENEIKNLPDLTNNLINTDVQLPSNNTTSILNNLTSTSNNQTTNKTNQNLINQKKLPILTADVVVEEILDNKIQDNKTQDTKTQESTGQSLGQSLVNTFLNKKANSNQSSVNNSPSQSIHSINSLSSSLLELHRSTSPTNLITSSPERIISKLTLQSFGHTENNKYIKHKNKKYDFKKKSKEKLLKNGDKNEIGNKKSQQPIVVVEKEKINNDQKKTEENKEDLKNNNTTNNHKQTETKQTVQTKEIGVGTNSIGRLDIFGSNFYSNFEASNLSLSSLTLPQGFFFNLRRTRSWKK